MPLKVKSSSETFSHIGRAKKEGDRLKDGTTTEEGRVRMSSFQAFSWVALLESAVIAIVELMGTPGTYKASEVIS